MSGSARLVDACVHCGFCLPACPTYRLEGQEMDSPRGRIYLMKQLADGALDARDPSVRRHIDACLGCLGCVTACPSGVRYDVLIEQTRAAIEGAGARPALDRAFRALLFAFLPHPRRLRWAAALQALYQKSGLREALRRSGALSLLPLRLRQLEVLAPDPAPVEALPRSLESAGPRRARAALLTGCVQSVYFSGVNAATARVLAAEGCEVVIPEGQGCCGALSLHAGRESEARLFAQALIERLEGEGVDYVAVNAAGCGSALKECAALFEPGTAWRARAEAFARRVRDVHELLDALPPRAVYRPIPVRAVYHDACHLSHGQGVRAQPRRLLRRIPELELRELEERDQCCGSAGVYNLLFPEEARRIGEAKARDVLRASAGLLVSANPGCTLQIQSLLREKGCRLPAVHPMELLDASLRPDHLKPFPWDIA